MALDGWLAAVLLAGSMVPQVMLVVQDGNARGTSWGMLVMWGLGEILGLVYVGRQQSVLVPLLANYGLNLVLLVILLSYKVRDSFRGRRVH